MNATEGGRLASTSEGPMKIHQLFKIERRIVLRYRA